jgi:dTDP-4-dehydrorhamnose 3,5-epimerase
MKFVETPLQGAYVIELDTIEDDRGFFARSWCKEEFMAHDLSPRLVQCNISFNQHKSTLRGMHYQAQPYGETKLVRCTRGAVYDVIIDLRTDSPTFKDWYSVELACTNHRMLYIPEDFAHGFLTLEDNSEVFYQMSEYYHPDYARGVRWDDPAFSIDWPSTGIFMSKKDRGYSDFLQEGG